MSAHDEARRLLVLAGKDLKALRHMLDVDAFDDEVFGFHAQQAIEKALKAWLALRNTDYPRTHDLSMLLGLLQEKGEDISGYFDLIEYNAFAVQFRYEAFEGEDEPLDRAAAVGRIARLVDSVARRAS